MKDLFNSVSLNSYIYSNFKVGIKQNDKRYKVLWASLYEPGQPSRGPFLERPGNLTGPKSYFEIKVPRKVGCVLTFNEVHFVSLADNATELIFKRFETLIWNGKQNSLTGPVITGSFEKRAPGSVSEISPGHSFLCKNIDVFI